MKTKYFVMKVYTCDRCEGTGIIENQIYAELEEELANMSYEELDKIYEEGIELFERDWFYKRGFLKRPKREIKCNKCYGTGEIEEKIQIDKSMYEKIIIE